ncbi:hypothetical protein Pla100_09880 [Neorhodopirellula pilleata]|uniref:Uncharacterized protein n=1 Tax=Neorhodopirellula pilleata TaxID=2714738 RepID=A0A5C6AY70_9BACT|nr:hypothetical protein Pla100_09880 [Neorhodopirellula pilleata]
MSDSMITGTIDAIAVDEKGVLLSFVPTGKPSTAQAPNFGDFPFRLDASSRYLTAMLELAKFAMENGLVVTACGRGDDRDVDFVLNDLRVFKNNE